MTFSEAYFWGDVSGEHEKADHDRRIVHAKVASAQYWPFLSVATSEKDFENRLQIVAERLEAVAGTDMYPEVVDALRGDYKLLTTAAGRGNWVGNVYQDPDHPNPYINGSRSECTGCNGWGKYGLGEDETQCDRCNGKGYIEHTKTAEKGGKPWDQDKDDSLKDESKKAEDQADDETDASKDNDKDKKKSEKDEDDSQDEGDDDGKGKSESDDDGDDKSKGGHPNWLSDKDREKDSGDKQKSDKAKKESAQKGPDNYSNGDSPCCDAPGHRPGKSGDFFCKDCGSTFKDKSIADASRKESAATFHPSDEKCGECGATTEVKRGPEGRIDKRTFHEPQCPMMQRTFSPKKESAYQPDPTASQRYYAPYESLESLPLNNGDLQGPDGYIEDLAQGEQRTPEAYARQTTPGTWSQGDGMPERQMPQSVQRGYQNVASIDKNGFVVWAEAELGKTATVMDREGYLVPKASVVDAVPGAPLAVNPFYFNHDADNGSNQAFPQSPQPQADAAAMSDRANEYGDVQPQVSSGSEQGDVDGDGYSRSNPGNHTASRDFSRVAFGDQHVTNYVNWAQQKGHNPDEVDTLKKYEQEPGISRGHTNYLADQLYVGGGDSDWRKNASNTNGQIVDHCPGCDKPRRVHSTAHGDELHHIHNDHVRCFGQVTSKTKTAGLTPDEYRAVSQEVEGLKYGDSISLHDHTISHGGHPDNPYLNLRHDPSGDPAGMIPAGKNYSAPHAAQEISHSLDYHAPRKRRWLGSNRTSAVGWGHNLTEADGPFTFSDGLQFNQDNYTSHAAKTAFDLSAAQYNDKSKNMHQVSVKDRGANLFEVKCNHCDYKSSTHGKENADFLADVHEDPKRRNATLDKNGFLVQSFDLGNVDDRRKWTQEEGLIHGGEHRDDTNNGENARQLEWDKRHPLRENDDQELERQCTDPASCPFHHTGAKTAADYLGRPDATNPTGRGPDEFKARTWDAFQTTRPMQSAEDRNVNTPVLPGDRIKTKNITPGNPQFDRLQQSDDGEDEDDE